MNPRSLLFTLALTSLVAERYAQFALEKILSAFTSNLAALFVFQRCHLYSLPAFLIALPFTFSLFTMVCVYWWMKYCFLTHSVYGVY